MKSNIARRILLAAALLLAGAMLIMNIQAKASTVQPNEDMVRQVIYHYVQAIQQHDPEAAASAVIDTRFPNHASLVQSFRNRFAGGEQIYSIKILSIQPAGPGVMNVEVSTHSRLNGIHHMTLPVRNTGGKWRIDLSGERIWP